MVSDSQPLAVGVIGTGGMGGRHVTNLTRHIPGARVVAVMDADPTRARESVSECDGATIFDDGYALIESQEVDAVVVATPDHTHAQFVLACLESHKAVFCEKPLATRLVDAEVIMEAERRIGRKLVQIGFMRRFDGQHQALKREVDSGAIGRPVLFRGWHRNVETGLYGVSNDTFLLNSAIHDLDAMRWFLDAEFESVYVRGVTTKPELEGEAFDLLVLHVDLSSPGGRRCLGCVEVYVTAGYGYEVGVEIVGTDGTALIEVPNAPIVRRDRWRGAHVAADWLERFQQAYIAELEAWVGSVRAGTHVGPDAWDGYMSLAGAVTAIEALQSRKPMPVRAPRRPEMYKSTALHD